MCEDDDAADQRMGRQGVPRASTGMSSGSAPPDRRTPLVNLTRDESGPTVWLHLPREIAVHFPDRGREARNGFLRFFREREHEVLCNSLSTTFGVRTSREVHGRDIKLLEKKIHRRLYRPLSKREAAEFLGVEGRLLRSRFGVEPVGRIPASRHGRNYSYAVYSVTDLINARCQCSPSTFT